MSFARTTLILAGVLVLAALPDTRAGAQRTRSGGFFSSDYRSRIDTTLAFDKNGTVTIVAGTGDVIVTASSNNQAHVHAVSDDENIRFDASSSNMTLEVGGSHRGSDSRFE